MLYQKTKHFVVSTALFVTFCLSLPNCEDQRLRLYRRSCRSGDHAPVSLFSRPYTPFTVQHFCLGGNGVPGFKNFTIYPCDSDPCVITRGETYNVTFFAEASECIAPVMMLDKNIRGCTEPDQLHAVKRMQSSCQPISGESRVRVIKNAAQLARCPQRILQLSIYSVGVV